MCVTKHPIKRESVLDGAAVWLAVLILPNKDRSPLIVTEHIHLPLISVANSFQFLSTVHLVPEQLKHVVG